MRVAKLIWICPIIVILFCSFSGLAHAQEMGKAPKLIKSSGCVVAGVEKGCLVLTGFKDKKTYDLFFSGTKPDVGMAITFEGTPGGADICMQGIVVKVTKWTHLKRKCP